MATHQKHEWLTRYEVDPECWDDGPEGFYGSMVGEFAYSAGFHNGPRCKNCGYSFCQHCKPNGYQTECKGRKS
jgi:hypothetical protein